MNFRFGVWLGVLGLLATGVAPLPVDAQASTDDPAQVLAMAMNPPMIPEPEFQDYVDAVFLSHRVGVNGNAFTEKWSVLEPDGVQIDDYVDGINGYQDFFHDTIMLGVQVINTTAKETPADLLDVPFDHPQMLRRFEALFDAILAALDHDARYLSIGNEVDVYLANYRDWDAYKAFYDGAVAYVHQVAPEIQVGVTVTYKGLLDYTDEVLRLNQNSDVLIVTYYPLGVAFTADNPDAPLTDFPMMIELAGGRPVVLQEVGYPSADLLDGSQAEQAQFVRSVFAAWEAAGGAIPFLDFFLLHDLSDDFCSELEAYYGLSHPNFHAYLCTLGLRAADGAPKLAWDAFAEEAERWRNGG
ncbi:MAG: hypothetical protein IT319_21255 [Anaerolineae bacterium]|nr:hypothetical protein [Anaerolineae bacterium]